MSLLLDVFYLSLIFSLGDLLLSVKWHIIDSHLVLTVLEEVHNGFVVDLKVARDVYQVSTKLIHDLLSDSLAIDGLAVLVQLGAATVDLMPFDLTFTFFLIAVIAILFRSGAVSSNCLGSRLSLVWDLVESLSMQECV